MSLVSRWVQQLRAERGCGPVPVVQPERCLRRYASSTPCLACTDACPVSSVELASTAVTLSKGCIGCEACVTACPTGALVPPPEIVSQRREGLDRGLEVVSFTCVRQPGRGSATIKVGCLAGLPLTTLLAPLTKSTCRVEVERGGCAGCGLAAMMVVAFDTTLEQARTLLSAFDISPERICEVEHFSQEVHALGEVVGRREFFMRLRTGANHAAAALCEEEGEGAVSMTEPQLAAVLRGFGVPAAGATLPAGLHAGMVRASETCFGCNVCETLCSTAALRITVEEGTTRLLFTPARCTGCGVCADACLANALTVTPTAGDDATPPLSDAYLGGEEVELVEVTPRVCIRCGVRFTKLPGELCDTCLTTGHGAGRLHGIISTGASHLC